eukprot:186856_1
MSKSKSKSKPKGPSFNPQTFKKLFESIWIQQGKTKEEVLELCAEYMRIMTNTCIEKAIIQAEGDQSTELNETHLRKVLIQALLDFR